MSRLPPSDLNLALSLQYFLSGHEGNSSLSLRALCGRGHSKCLRAFGIPKPEGKEETNQWENSGNRNIMVVDGQGQVGAGVEAKEKIKVHPDEGQRPPLFAVTEGPPWPAWPGIQVQPLSELAAHCLPGVVWYEKCRRGPCVVSWSVDIFLCPSGCGQES